MLVLVVAASLEAVLALDANDDDDEEKFCARTCARAGLIPIRTAPTRAKLRDNKRAGMLWSVGQVLLFACVGGGAAVVGK